MIKRAVLAAVIAAAGLAGPVAGPASATVSDPGAVLGSKAGFQCPSSSWDLWSGKWDFEVDGGDPGTLYLSLPKAYRGNVVTGRYYGNTNGKISGPIDRTCNGQVWWGSFQDTSGVNHNAGRFRVVREGSYFSGWFKVGSSKYTWHASKTFG